MPASELIDVLALDEADPLQTRSHSSPDFLVRTIRIPECEDTDLPAGPEILFNELAPTREFELIHKRSGYLLAIFPVLSEETKARSQLKNLFYFDFTPYYFRLPRIGDPLAEKRWIAFAEEQRANQELLDAYKLSVGMPEQVSKLFDRYQQSYVYAELDPTGDLAICQFDPNELSMRARLPARKQALLERMFAADSERPRIVFPVFPTVYSPGSQYHQLEDLGYYIAVRHFAAEQRLRDGDRSLVVGAGSGIDAWLVWESTHQPVYAVGINPLEVANVRTTARLAQFPLEAKVYDNLISADGSPAFGDLRFQLVCCNAPFYVDRPSELSTPPAGKPKGLSQYWDGDTGEFIERLAGGLRQVLDPGRGIAVVWNRSSGGVVEQAFAASALDIRHVVVYGDDDEEVELEDVNEVVYVLAASRDDSPGP